MNQILEFSSRMSKGGRRKIKMILLTIHDESETNGNGIHWSENYINENLPSITNIPICCEFLTDDKSVPHGHGYTECIELEDGNVEPVFTDSETVGVIVKAYIDDVEIDGVLKRVLVGEGYIFCQRYPNFMNWLKENLKLGNVKSSIEIMGTEDNDHKIQYDGGYNETFRIPQTFDFSATAILSVKEADENCLVLEVAQKKNKEEEHQMDENKIIEVVKTAIMESNSVKDDIDGKLSALNETIETKDTEINELKDAKSAADTEISAKDEEIKTLKEANEELKKSNEDMKKELDKAKASELNSKLDKKLLNYTDAQKKCVESEINAFREDPLKGDVDAIVSKICVGIVNDQIEEEKKRQTELNSRKEDDLFDIVSEVNEEDDPDDKLTIWE